MHGDIKPNNFIFTENKIIKLIDFSLAQFHACLDFKIDSDIYSGGYRAPELIYNEDVESIEKFGYAADIWALGIMIYRIYLNNEYLLMNKILVDSKHVDPIRYFLDNKEAKLKQIEDIKLRKLLNKMLNENQSERPTIYEVLTDDYFLEKGLIFKGLNLTCFDKLLLECPEKINVDKKYKISYSSMIEHIKDGYNRYNNYYGYTFNFSLLTDLITESTWFLYNQVCKKLSEDELSQKSTSVIVLACLMIYVKIYTFSRNIDMLDNFQIRIIEVMEGNLIFSTPDLFIKVYKKLNIIDNEIKKINKINEIFEIMDNKKIMNVSLSAIILKIFSEGIENYSNLDRTEIIKILTKDENL